MGQEGLTYSRKSNLPKQVEHASCQVVAEALVETSKTLLGFDSMTAF